MERNFPFGEEHMQCPVAAPSAKATNLKDEKSIRPNTHAKPEPDGHHHFVRCFFFDLWYPEVCSFRFAVTSSA